MQSHTSLMVTCWARSLPSRGRRLIAQTTKQSRFDSATSCSRTRCGIRLRRHGGIGGDLHDGGQLRVEVKAPYVPLLSDAWCGDDSDVLAKCVKKAGQQFDEAMTNIYAQLVLRDSGMSWTEK